MTLTIADITDNDFQKLSDTDKALYLARGLSRFTAMCTQAGVDITLIPQPAPYVPVVLTTTLAVMAYCVDNFGSNFREIRDGVVFDVYKQKYDALSLISGQLLSQLSNATCGIVTDPETPGMSFTMTLGRG